MGRGHRKIGFPKSVENSASADSIVVPTSLLFKGDKKLGKMSW